MKYILRVFGVIVSEIRGEFILHISIVSLIFRFGEFICASETFGWKASLWLILSVGVEIWVALLVEGLEGKLVLAQGLVGQVFGRLEGIRLVVGRKAVHSVIRQVHRRLVVVRVEVRITRLSVYVVYLWFLLKIALNTLSWFLLNLFFEICLW